MQGERIHVLGNLFKSGYQQIALSGQRGTVIANNVLYGATNSNGIAIAVSHYSHVSTPYSCTDCLITDNILYGCRQGIIITGAALNGVSGLLVKNNQIVEDTSLVNLATGISEQNIATVLNNIIEGNRIIGAGTGISAAGAPGNGTQVRDNMVDTTFGGHTHAASDVISGTMATARLGSGVADNTTFLSGDQTWATPASGGAPTTATYITQTADGTLSNEQALSSLSTGYMKVTTGTGVVSSQATPIPQADLGTGSGGAGTKFLADDQTYKTPAGTGTVTSVAMTVPADMSVGGSPVTTTGTLAVTRNNQNANLVLAGPASGAAATPAFRALVQTDLPTDVAQNPPAFFTDFLFDLPCPSGSTGANSSASLGDTGAVDLGGHPGQLVLNCGTTTTGRGAIGAGGSGITQMLFGNGALTYETAVFLIDAVSDGTDTYSIFLGFNDSVGTTGTDAIMFRYTHSVNSGKWECVTRSNGAETAADSGITVTTTTWYKLGITVNAAGTSVAFSINGSVVATNVATIPTGTGRQTTPWHSITKSAGTNARRLAMDYLYYKLALTSSR